MPRLVPVATLTFPSYPSARLSSKNGAKSSIGVTSRKLFHSKDGVWQPLFRFGVEGGPEMNIRLSADWHNVDQYTLLVLCVSSTRRLGDLAFSFAGKMFPTMPFSSSDYIIRARANQIESTLYVLRRPQFLSVLHQIRLERDEP